MANPNQYYDYQQYHGFQYQPPQQQQQPQYPQHHQQAQHPQQHQQSQRPQQQWQAPHQQDSHPQVIVQNVQRPQQHHSQYRHPQVFIQNPQPQHHYGQPYYPQYDGSAPRFTSQGPYPPYQQAQPPQPQQQAINTQHAQFAAQIQQAAYGQQQPAYPTPPAHTIPSDTIAVRHPEPDTMIVTTREPDPPRPPSPEYELVLMSMADEYLNAAYTQAASAVEQGDGETYYRLIATALACMDTVLKRWRLQPLLEAKLRLQYAKVLIEETENVYEAETVLTRGIDLAKENNLWDLQYTMQLLLARLQHQLNPKAATKAVDSIIEDVEAYRHVQWIYVFRFLRMSLSSSPSSNTEVQASVQNSQKIQAFARRHGDHAILVWAAAMEALNHLKFYSSDALDQAQRALATARQMQLDPKLKNSPQLQILLQLIDVCCSLQESDQTQVQKKTLALQQMMDTVVDDPAWVIDGAINIPISRKSTAGLTSFTNEIVGEKDGEAYITVSWITKQDVYAIGYIVSAVGIAHKNATDGHKAERFLKEGVALVRKCLQNPESVYQSISRAEDQSNFRRVLEAYFLLQLCFLSCARGKLDTAQSCIDDLKRIMGQMSEPLPLDVKCQVKYLTGTIKQANGDLDEAISIYQDPELTLSPASIKTPHSHAHFHMCLLAAMNIILIIRDEKHPLHYQLEGRLSWLSTVAAASPAKDIMATYNVILATLPNITHLQLKEHLSRALKLAKEVNNHQVTSMTLGLMSWKWFRGVVGEQAEKGAMAMHAMAKKSGNPLWVSVADGMLSDTLDRMGKRGEAESSAREGRELWHGLPKKVKASIESGS